MNQKLLNKKERGECSIDEKKFMLLRTAGLVKARCDPKRLELFALANQKEDFESQLFNLVGSKELDETITISWLKGEKRDYIVRND